MAYCGKFNKGKITRFAILNIDNTLGEVNADTVLQFNYDLVSSIMKTHFTAGSHNDINSAEFAETIEMAIPIVQALVLKAKGVDMYSEIMPANEVISEAIAQYKAVNEDVDQTRFAVESLDIDSLNPSTDTEDEFVVPKSTTTEDAPMKSLAQIAEDHLTDGDTITDLVTLFKEEVGKYIVNDEVGNGITTGVNTISEIDDFIKKQARQSAYKVLMSQVGSTLSYIIPTKNGFKVRDIQVIDSFAWESMDKSNFTKISTDPDKGASVYQSNDIRMPDDEFKFATVIVLDDVYSVSNEDIVTLVDGKVAPGTSFSMAPSSAMSINKETAESDQIRRLNNVIAAEFPSLLSEIYPQLYKKVKENIRTGFLAPNITAVFLSDQESQRMKLLKATTRRLSSVEMDGDTPVLVQSNKNPFLFTQEFDLVSDELRLRTSGSLTSDAVLSNNDTGTVLNSSESLKTFLEEKLLHENDPKYDIYLSIYYRFFYEGKYMIKSGTKNTTHKSIVSIYNTMSSVDMTETDYHNARNYNSDVKTTSDLEARFNSDNNKLRDVLSSFMVSIGSNAYNDRIPDLNGVVNLPENREVSAVSNLYNNIQAAVFGTSEDGNRLILLPKIQKLINDRLTIKDKTVSIKIDGDVITFNVKKSDESGSGRDSQEGIPYIVTGMSTGNRPPSIDTLRRMFHSIGVPADISNNVLTELQYFLNASNDTAKFGKTEYQLSGFLVNLMYAIQENSRLKASGIKETLYGYNKVLEAALERTHGSSKNRTMLNSTGEIVPTQTVASKYLSTKLEINYVIRDADSDGKNMSSGSFLAKKKLRMLRASTKDGFVKGDTRKAAENLTINENLQQAMESYFIGRLAHSNGSQFIIQPMNMADRKAIMAVLFGSVGEAGYKAFPIQYSGNTRRTGPDALDINFLKEQWYESHSEYFKRYEKNLLEQWNTILLKKGVIISEVKSAEVLVGIVKAANLSFDDILQTTGLTVNAFVVKGPGGTAQIPQSNVNKVNIFKNKEMALMYADLQLEIFNRGLREIGYTYKNMSKLALSNTAQLLGTSYGGNEVKLFNAMSTAYFFAQTTAGLELARILNGGEVQYKQFKAGPTDFIIESVQDKGVYEIMSELRAGIDPDITYPSGSTMELYQEMLKSNMTDAEMTLAVRFNQTATMESSGFIDQLKRNSMLSTTGMSARLANDNEPGAFLTSHTNMVTVEEWTELLDVIGHAQAEAVDPYDGVMLLHPAYRILYNNSFGNLESAYSTRNGSAIKDITLTTDEFGIIHAEKKASFDAWNTEMLKNATPSHIKLVRLMGEAIEYNDGKGRLIFVDKVNADGTLVKKTTFDKVITEEIWNNNGIALGLIAVKNSDGNNTITTVAKIRGKIASGEMTLTELQDNLKNGVYLTDKQEVLFSHFQDVWDYFGFTDNDSSLVNAVNLVSNVSSGGDVSLQDVKYDIRDSLVHKIGHESQLKIGIRSLISSESFKDPIGTGLSLKGRHVRSLNNNNRTVLNAQHSPEITANRTSLTENGEEISHEPSRVTLIRQMIAANNFQGRSKKESDNISVSLAVLSSIQLKLLQNKIFSKIIQGIEEEYEKLHEVQKIMREQEGIPMYDHKKLLSVYHDLGTREFNTLKEQQDWERENAELIEDIDRGIGIYVRDLLKEQMASIGSGGLSSEILQPEFINSLSFNLNQIMPYAQNKVYSEYNKAGIQLKFGGGQYVVSASHDHLSTYTVSSAIGNISHMTRSDLNKAAYGNPGESLTVETEERRAELGFVDRLVTPETINLITPTDLVTLQTELALNTDATIKPGVPITLSLLTNKLRRDGKTIEDAYEAGLSSRLLSVYENKEVDSKLRWMAYTYRDPKTGEMIDFTKSSEYLTWRTVTQIIKGKDISTVGNEKAIEILDKAYYLIASGYRTELDQRLFILSDNEKAEYSRLTRGRDVGVLTDEVIAWVKENPSLIKIAEKVIESSFLNDDGTKSWYTKPAEFYSPILSKLTFYLNDSDTIRDIEGMNADPDIESVVTDGTLTYEEQVTVQHFYNRVGKISLKQASSEHSFVLKGGQDAARVRRNVLSGKQILLRKRGAYIEELKTVKTLSEQQELERKIANIDKYIQQRDTRTTHITEWFKRRITDNIKKEELFNFRSIINKGMADGRGLHSVLKTYDNVIRNLNKLQRESKKDAILYGILEEAKVDVAAQQRSAYLDGEDALLALSRLKNDLHATLNFGSDSYITKLINKKAITLAESFDMSLRFITGRIPGQGKQSSVSGIIKAFITGQQNSSFSALEMLIITGADYDIDKQNLMAYLIADSGENIFWGEYTEDGSLDSPISQRIYEERLEGKLKGRKPEEKQAIEAYELTRFSLAVHNNIIYNLIKTIESPKNAIEAATKIDAERLEEHIQPKSYAGLAETINKSPYKVLEIIHANNKSTSMNPMSMFKSERDALDGKDGVSITASQLRAFAVTYQSFISAADDMKGDYFLFRSQYSDQEITEMQAILKGIFPDRVFEFDRDAIQVPEYDEDGEFIGIKNLRTIATAEMFIPTKEMKNMKFNARVDSYREELKAAGTDDNAHLRIMDKYAKEMNLLGDIRIQPQVWEELSSILSAATDNAKLMILGRIGVTGTTNSIVATMLHSGMLIKDAIRIIREVEALEKADPKVKIFSALKDSRDTSKEQSKEPVYTLREAIDRYEKTNKEAISGINALINPVMQLKSFVDLSEEFTAVATMTSIQTGMPVPMKDSYSYFFSFENQINSKIAAYNAESKSDKINKFNLQKFVRAAAKMQESDGSYNDPYVEEMISGYNKVKAGLNIPFIFKNTPQLFNYYITAFEANKVVGRVMNIYSMVDGIIRSTQDENSMVKLRGIPQIHEDLKNSIVRFTVSKYLSSLTGDDAIFKVPGFDDVIFDVSRVERDPRNQDPEAEISIDGRKEFVELMAVQGINNLKSRFPENRMISRFTASLRTDNKSQEVMHVARGVVLNDISKDEFTMLQADMDQLKNEDYDAYKALFMYNLIVHNAKFGGGSVAALAHTDMIEGYSKYLKENIKSIEAEVKGYQREFSIMVPELLPKLKTYNENKGNTPATEDMEPEDMEYITRSTSSSNRDTSDVSYHNDKKLEDDNYPDEFVSSTDGRIFTYDKALGSYVTLQFVHHNAINTFNPFGATMEERIGAAKGVILNRGMLTELRILMKADTKFKEFVKKSNKKGQLLGIRPDDINNEVTQYVVQRGNSGEYVLISKNVLEKEIARSNSPLRLMGRTIKKLAIQGERASAANDFVTIVTLDGKLYAKNLDSGLTQKELNARAARLKGGMNSTLRIPQEKRINGDMIPFELNTSNIKLFDKVLADAKAGAKSMSNEDVIQAAELVHHISEAVRLASQFNGTMSIGSALGNKSQYKEMPTFSNSAEAVEYIHKAAPSFDVIRQSTSAPISIIKALSTIKALTNLGIYNSEGDVEPFYTTSMLEELQNDATNGRINYTKLRTKLSAIESDKFNDLVAIHMNNTGADFYTDVSGLVILSSNIYNEFVKKNNIKKPKESRISVSDDLASSNKSKVNKQVMNAIMLKVEKALPKGYSVVLLTTKEIEEDPNLEIPDASKTRGFVQGNVIVYNSDLMNMDTPLHEYSHVYFAHLKYDNNELYRGLIKKALSTELYEEMKQRYPELSEDELGEEILAELVSKFQTMKGDRNIEAIKKTLSKKSTFDTVINFLANFFNGIFGTNLIQSNVSFTTIIDQIGIDVLSETGGIFESFSKRAIDMIAMSNTGSDIDITAARKLLEEHGYIYTICR